MQEARIWELEAEVARLKSVEDVAVRFRQTLENTLGSYTDDVTLLLTVVGLQKRSRELRDALKRAEEILDNCYLCSETSQLFPEIGKALAAIRKVD